MSTWITAPGSIGTYTQNRQFVYEFAASSDSGGAIRFELAPNSSWPPGTWSLVTTGPVMGIYTGTLTATPAYVSDNVSYDFTLTATEYTGTQTLPNNRAFSVTVSTTHWLTPSGSLGIYPELVPFTYQFEAQPSQPGNTLIYTLLNGSYPTASVPFTLSQTGLLTGTPGQINANITSEFTIRVQEQTPTGVVVGIADRSFSLTISGITPPQFTTPPGNILTVFDSKWINFQIGYSNPDQGATTLIRVAQGNLPPGIEINSTGLIRGYAAPPLQGNGQPGVGVYNFTLELISSTGSARSDYSIVTVNQELLPGFAGRAPTLLNTRPPSFTIPDTDPYKPYYFTPPIIGTFAQDNDWIWKFIGYDFDGDPISYEVSGLTGPPLYMTVDTTGGWVSGVLPYVGETIYTYAFTVIVYKTANPALNSGTFVFAITVQGNIILDITWKTDSDLGVITNGSASTFQVSATNPQVSALRYNLAGRDFSNTLNSVTPRPTGMNVVGPSGTSVTSNTAGTQWTLGPNLNLYNLLDISYYEPTNKFVAVGTDSANNPLIVVGTDFNSWSAGAFSSPNKLWAVNCLNGVWVTVGDGGQILRSTDGLSWATVSAPTTETLYDVENNGLIFVAVGSGNVILYSYDGISWYTGTVVQGLLNDYTSVCWTGTQFIVVGLNGVTGRSSDGIIWTFNPPTQVNYLSVVSDQNIASGGTPLTVAVCQGGYIQRTSDGITWSVSRRIVTNDLFNICFDRYNTRDFFAVGAAGAVLRSSDGVNWTSPTLPVFPANMLLQPNGLITGDLQFENTSVIVEQDVRKTYDFTVQATSTQFPEISSTKQFSFTTVQEHYLPYDNLYIRALLPEAQRAQFRSLLANPNIIPSGSVYRLGDPNFGINTTLRYQHMFGVPSQASQDFYQNYITAITKNHYWRDIVLGPIKTAVARDSKNNIIYEVVYSEVVDNLVNAQGKSVSKQVNWPRPIPLNLNEFWTSNTNYYTTSTYIHNDPVVKTVTGGSGMTLILNSVDGIMLGQNMTGQGVANHPTLGTPPTVLSINPTTKAVGVSVPQAGITGNNVLFWDPATVSLTPGTVQSLYPNSLDNMRQQIADTLGQINSLDLLPLWMRSQQLDGSIPGYVQAWVIVYTQPGFSKTIAQNIASLWPYKLNDFQFTIDRFEVERKLTFNYQGTSSTGVPQWTALPSGQPEPFPSDSSDSYVLFTQKTILPASGQE